MLGQVDQQSIHVRKGGSVNEVAAVALLADQVRVQQFFEVKGQCGGWNRQSQTQITRCEPLMASHHQSPEDAQAHGLGQGGQRFDDGLFFHCSIMIESLLRVKYQPRFRGGRSQ
jgi:hypothetical protein